MKKILPLVVFLGVFMIAQSVSATETPPAEVVNAAKEGLSTFLQAIPQQILPQFGFQSAKETEGAELGEGFQIFTIFPDQLLNDDKNLSDLDSLIVPTDLWEFLVLKDNQAKCVLTVDFFKNRWTTVGIGSSGLAVELKKIVESWPTSGGYQHTLIRIYQAKSDFVEISKEETSIGLIPLTSARVAMGMADHNLNPLDLQDSRSVLSSLIPIIRENLQTGR